MSNNLVQTQADPHTINRHKLFFWLALPAVALTLVASGSARAQAYANLTLGGAFAPGVYGQIAIGNNPPPPVINAQPVIIGRPVYGAPVMYLHVPPKEARDWRRHCARYHACGHPVHFVQTDPRNRWWAHDGEHHRGDGYRSKHEHGRDDRQDQRRAERRDSRPSYSGPTNPDVLRGAGP